MENQHPFIVLLLGDCNTGKTTIVERYLENKLVDPQPTVGVVKRDSQIDICNSNQKAQIYDTSGNEKFRAQVLAEFKNAKAVVLVYDITDYQSFQNVQTLQKEVIRQNPNIDFWILVGNKLDLKEQRKVNIDEGKKFASQIGARFIECSAQQPSNINLIFLTIQQWTQINIQPKYVPEQTQRLLEKLNNDEQQKQQLQTSNSKNNQTKFKNKNTSFSLIQNNTNNIVSQSFDDQQNSFNGDSIQDYFAQLLKKTDIQKLADVIVEEAQDNVIQSLRQETLLISNSKPLCILDEVNSQLQDKIENKILMMKKKHKQLDKLRKEIAQNLLLVQEQRKKLTADQVIENTQTQKLERELQKRLLSVERNMDFLKTDILLSQKTQKFSTNNNNFLSNDQSLIIKQHISQIHNPEHIKEQNEQIAKIKNERKKLEEQRNHRYKQYVDNLEALQKQEKEIRLKNEQDLIQKRKEKAMQKIASMDKMRQERSQQMIKQNEQVKQIIGTTPLHVKLENIFQEKINNTQLEEHKLKLKQIRDLHQPIRMNDLKQWEENYEKRRKSQENIRNQKIIQNNQITYQPSYESSIYKQVKEEQSKQFKDKDQTHKDYLLNQQAKQEFLNKLKDYLPSISPEKQQELEQIINKAHHKINFYEFIEMTKKVKLKGVFFDKEGKIVERNVDEEYYEKIKENERNEEQSAKVIGNKYLNDIRKIIKKPSQHESVDKLQSQSNPEQGYQQAVRNPKQNKLNEIKSHWKLKPKLIFEETDLEKIIDGNEVAGFSNHHVMQEANKLASEAVRKIQIIEAKGQGKECFKDIDSADKLLINSIKAKLTLMEKELKSENRGITTNQKRGRSNTKQHS
ncbi:unnamed protein product [Paramecium pentaurelia]|uniref:P-loop containing nucleoside triphosphate hydrolase n=1 Tax=Paramecium pentaurelia TaxID=43138 RepID=A0A8S1WSC4_9CILI|nr:unnamed protein product [Paramecium pentaurelia]